MQITRKLAYVGQATFFLCLLLLTSACQNASPSAHVNTTTCTSSHTSTASECDFSISYPEDATGTFKFLIVVSDPQYTKVTPMSSGVLTPGLTQNIIVTFQRCPTSITVEDAGQQDHPAINTTTEPCAGSGGG